MATFPGPTMVRGRDGPVGLVRGEPRAFEKQDVIGF